MARQNPTRSRGCAVEEPHDQPFEKLSLSLLKRPLPGFVAFLFITSFCCAVGRLADVAVLLKNWRHGKPGLCYGLMTAFDGGAHGFNTTFTLTSISNAIAIQAYNETSANACRTRDYTHGLLNSSMNSIYIYLLIASVVDLVVMCWLYWACWAAVFTEGCPIVVWMRCLCLNVLIIAFDAGSIAACHIRGLSAAQALSAIILICNFGLLFLKIYVKRSKVNRGRESADMLEVKMSKWSDILTRPSERNAGSSSQAETEMRPRAVRMYNPTRG